MDGSIIKDQKPLFELFTKGLHHCSDVLCPWRTLCASPSIHTFIPHKYTQSDHFFFQTSFLSDQRLSDGCISEFSLDDLTKPYFIHKEQFPFIELVLVYLCILIPKAFVLLRISFEIDVRSSFFSVTD